MGWPADRDHRVAQLYTPDGNTCRVLSRLRAPEIRLTAKDAKRA